jgi:thymidylate synthase
MSRRHIVSAWNPADLPREYKWVEQASDDHVREVVKRKLTPHDNVRDGKAALAFCHDFFQFYVRPASLDERVDFYINENDNDFDDDMDLLGLSEEDQLAFLEKHEVPIYKLDCRFDVRSNDMALGFPYNVASYAALTMMMAQCVNMMPGELIYQGGDIHLYKNHIEGMKEQLTRKPFHKPQLVLNKDVKDIFKFTVDDFKLEGYQFHPAIKFDVSV